MDRDRSPRPRRADDSSAPGLRRGDPRPSIKERYPSKEVYLAAFRKAADDLVAQRYLLPEDAKLLVGRAESDGVSGVAWPPVPFPAHNASSR